MGTVNEEKRMEAMAALVNAGLKSGAEVLNQMLETDIRMATPAIQMLEKDFEARLSQPATLPLTVVEMGFDGRLKGNSGLIFDEESARRFVEKVSGEAVDPDEFDFVSAGVLTEIGNIVLNRVMGAISNALSLSLDYVVPTFFQGELERLWRDTGVDTDELTGMMARTRFEIADVAANGNIVLFFDRDSYQILQTIMAEMPLLD